jgi:type II restriction enzyme
MENLRCTQIKAESLQKSDIFLAVHDRISPVITEQGFSVKSMLGGPSTLLNASGATNFTFQINDLKAASESINLIDGSSKVRERAEKIYKAGAAIVFKEVENENFRRNLRKIDTAFPEIMAEVILAYYQGKGRTMAELVASLEENKILQTKYGLSNADYEFKIKNFLVAIALGMTPNREWNGLTSAQGGYIIVKENGDLVCYHLYNRDKFQEYLYKNTKLETASTSRHEFGDVYEKDGKKFIKLNLQIRFIK